MRIYIAEGKIPVESLSSRRVTQASALVVSRGYQVRQTSEILLHARP